MNGGLELPEREGENRVPTRGRSTSSSTMHPNQFATVLARARCSSRRVRVTRQHLVAYPRHVYVGAQYFPAAAFVCRVADGRLSVPTEHTVIVCMYRSNEGEHTEFWCADKFLEGRLSFTDAHERSRLASAALGTKADSGQLAMMSSHAMFSASGSCSFWQGWRRAKTCCGHVACALGALRSRKGDVVQELRAQLTRMG